MEDNKRDWLIFPVAVLIIILAIVFVPWSDIVDWLSDIALNIWTLFFWGLFLIIFAVLTPIFLIWHRRFTLFLKYWYRWLGIIALTLAVWGIFAFNGVGGTIGMAIIGGETDAWGIFRIVLLSILAIILVVPRVTDWLMHKKDAVVSTMKSAGTQQQEESLKPEEVVFDRKEYMQTNGQQESRTKKKKRGEMSWGKLWGRYAINAIGLVAIFIWAGLVLLGHTTNWGPDTFRWWDSGNWWAIIIAGAGAILILCGLIRLLMPEYRRPIIGYLVMGFVFLGVGLGEVTDWEFSAIGAIILGIVLFVAWVIAAWLKPIKDTEVSTLISENTRRQEEAQPFKEAASDGKAHTQANAQPESRLKMKCRNCGNELVGAPAFCVYCGAKVQIEQKYCPTCGAATYQSAVFCTKCGTRLLEV